MLQKYLILELFNLWFPFSERQRFNLKEAKPKHIMITKFSWKVTWVIRWQNMPLSEGIKISQGLLSDSARQWSMFSGATSIFLVYHVKIEPTVILRQLQYPGSPLCIAVKREGNRKCLGMTENTHFQYSSSLLLKSDSSKVTPLNTEI